MRSGTPSKPGLTNLGARPPLAFTAFTSLCSISRSDKEVIRRLDQALEDFTEIEPAIAELETYYTSSQWRKDFEADEAGKLPKDLKRGVLSEDGVWNLLTDYRRLKETICKK